MRSEQIKDEISKLGLSEKLLLVEDIWDSIATSNLEIPMPTWQKQELDKRYEEYKEGKQNFMTGKIFTKVYVTSTHETALHGKSKR